MSVHRAWIVPVGLQLVAGMAGCGDRHRPVPEAARDAAIAEIERLGGRYRGEKGNRHRTIVAVDLNSAQATDAGLGHLKELTNLQELDLSRTQITDTGLECLKGLTSLETLYLRGTQITDTGLEHLTGLANLQELYLKHTQVTDVGLEHPKGLTNFEWLSLNDTSVTDAGVKELKKVLPKCQILH